MTPGPGPRRYRAPRDPDPDGVGADQAEHLQREMEREDRAKARSPRKVAEGAINRLCAYDAVNAPANWERTAERIASFQREFSLLAAERLATVARKADPATSSDRVGSR